MPKFFGKNRHTGNDRPYQKRSSLPNRRRFLPLAATEIIQFRPTGATLLFHFHFCDARRMQGKYPFDTLAVRDTAHGERFVEPATLPADYHASKDLDSFLVSFHDARS